MMLVASRIVENVVRADPPRDDVRLTFAQLRSVRERRATIPGESQLPDVARSLDSLSRGARQGTAPAVP